MLAIGKNLARELNITGPFNIQFLLKDNEIYIIETNLRASRTFPFIAKVTGINLIELFVNAIFQKNIPEVKMKDLNYTAVKVAQFSFARLIGAHPQLGVEMASTGEVACFGKDVEEAYLKGVLATGGKIPERGIFISLGGDNKKKDFLESCKKLIKLNLPLYATEKTVKFMADNGIKTKKLYKIYEKKSPNIIDYFHNGKIDLVINIVDKNLQKDIADSFEMRRAAADSNIMIVTKVKQATLLIDALVNKGAAKLEVKPWSEYL